jgi:hypothetical protein
MVDYIGRLITVLDTDNSGLIKGMGVAKASVESFEATVRSSNRTLELFGVAIGAAMAIDVTKKAFAAGEAYTNLNRKIAAMSNSMTELGYKNATTGEMMKWVASTADQMAVSFDSLGNTFAKMAPMLIAHKIALSDIKAMVTNTIGAGVMMGATNEQMTRVFIALREIIAENALSMQHLRRQLGDALPTSMLILVQGANKVKNQFANLRNETEITWSTIQKLIHTKAIDDKEFVAMWVAGSADMAKFADAQKTQISGQLVNLKNFWQADIGRFMSESGLNQYFAGLLDVINRKLRELMGSVDPKEFAAKVEREFENLILGVTRFYDQIKGALALIADSGKWLLSTFNSLPSELQSIGLIGFMLFGKTGKVAIVATLAMLPTIKAFAADVKATFQPGEDNLDFEKMFDPFRRAVKDMQHLDDILTKGQFQKILTGFGQLPVETAKALTDTNKTATEKLEILKGIFNATLADMAASQKQFKFDPGSWLLPSKEGLKHALDGQTAAMSDLKDHIKYVNGELRLFQGVWASVLSEISDPAEAEKAVGMLTDLRDRWASLMEAMMRNGAPEKEVAAYRTMIESANGYIEVLKNLGKGEDSVKEKSGSAAEAMARIFKDARSKGAEFQSTIADMEKVQGLIKAMAEDKEPALKDLTPTQMHDGLEKVIHDFEVLGKDYAIDTIKDKFRQLTDYLNSDVTKAFINIYQHMTGLKNVAETIRFGGVEEVLTKLSHFSFTGSPEQMKEQFGAAKNAMSELHDEFMKDGLAMGKTSADLGAEWAFINNELTSNYDSHMSSRLTKDDSAIRKMLDAHINAAKSLTESYSKASEALYTYITNRRLFQAEADKERFLIKTGELDPGAAMGDKSKDQLQELVFQGKLADGRKRLFDIDQQIAALERGDIKQQMVVEELQNMELTHRKAVLELEARTNGPSAKAFEIALIKERNDNFAKEMQVIALRRTVQDNPAGIQQTLQMEMEKLRDEYRNLLLKIALQSSGEYQQLFVQTEVTKLVSQEVDLRNQLKLATDGAYLAEQRKVQALQDQLKLQQMINSYQVDFGTYLQNNIISSTGQFTSLFSNALTGLITGTRTLKQTFQDLFKSIIGQIIQMFATWALQRAVAWALQAAGLVTATVETTAAATAATAAWEPAAYFASVATLGGAAATGAAALLSGLASVTASSAGIGAAGGLGGAVAGARAEGGPVNAGEFYLVGEKGPELFKPNAGGSIIPNHQMDHLLDSMHRNQMNHASGLNLGHLDTAGDRMDGYMIAAMSTPKAEIVNYFSHDEVMKHIARNPAAIVNVMVQDHRNGGPMRRISPTRRSRP